MNRLDLDFLEIGTSDFETCIQTCSDDDFGISVEPLKYYLDRLPNKKNVIKVNAAISKDDETGSIDVYYIPSDVIADNNLQDWLRGCNTVGGYHPLHISYGLTHLVKTEKVDLISIAELLTRYNVVGIKFLKIDTEGYDCYILQSLIKYLKNKPTEYYPDSILFESNENTDKSFVQSIIQAFQQLNYDVVYSAEDNTLLRKNKV
jgi:FkbM family methyltransferase